MSHENLARTRIDLHGPILEQVDNFRPTGGVSESQFVRFNAAPERANSPRPQDVRDRKVSTRAVSSHNRCLAEQVALSTPPSWEITRYLPNAQTPILGPRILATRHRTHLSRCDRTCNVPRLARRHQTRRESCSVDTCHRRSRSNSRPDARTTTQALPQNPTGPVVQNQPRSANASVATWPEQLRGPGTSRRGRGKVLTPTAGSLHPDDYSVRHTHAQTSKRPARSRTTRRSRRSRGVGVAGGFYPVVKPRSSC